MGLGEKFHLPPGSLFFPFFFFFRLLEAMPSITAAFEAAVTGGSLIYAAPLNHLASGRSEIVL